MAISNFSFSKLPRRTQIIVLAFLILGLGYAFHVYYLSPLQEEVQRIQMEANRLSQEIEQGRLLQARLAEFKKVVANQEARLAQLRRALPDEKETAEIIRQVQQLAVDSKLRLKSFTPQKTINNGFYQDWPILMSIEGNYNRLGDFFAKVSQISRIVNVEDITIRSLESNRGQERTIGATCRARTFVYIDQSSTEKDHASEKTNQVAAAF